MPISASQQPLKLSTRRFSLLRNAAGRQNARMTDSPAEASGPPSSILAARVAIDANGPLPSVATLGLERARTQAFEWQQQRSLAKWNDLAGTITGRPGARWVIETHAIIGVIAEQVLLAIELEVEKQVARAALDGLSASTFVSKASVGAHYCRSLRFFAESQANAIVIALHGLANVSARSLEFDGELTSAELKELRVSRADFMPGSTSRSAWLSWSHFLITKIGAIAMSRSAEMQTMAAELDKISRDSALVALLDLRNTQYHRWRGESAGVTGIALGTPPAADVLASGQSVSFGTELLPPYIAGQGTLDEVVAASRDALDAFAGRMESFLAAWGATLPHG